MLQICGGSGIGRRFSGLCSKGTDAKGRTSSSISCESVAQRQSNSHENCVLQVRVLSSFKIKIKSESVRH